MIPGLQPVGNSLAHPAPKATRAYPGKGRLDRAETARPMARPSPWIRAFSVAWLQIPGPDRQRQSMGRSNLFLQFITIPYMTFFEKIIILKKICSSPL
jgi:hypothetical protein